MDSEKYGLIDVTSSSAHIAENDTAFLCYWKHPEEVSSDLVSPIVQTELSMLCPSIGTSPVIKYPDCSHVPIVPV